MRSQFSPTEQRMLAVLADGLRHTKKELFACLDDDLAEIRAIRGHICRLRPKLNKIGEHIVSEFYLRKHYYRQVILKSRSDS